MSKIDDLRREAKARKNADAKYRETVTEGLDRLHRLVAPTLGGYVGVIEAATGGRWILDPKGVRVPITVTLKRSDAHVWTVMIAGRDGRAARTFTSTEGARPTFDVEEVAAHIEAIARAEIAARWPAGAE
jgi:hypothetical protein